MKKAKAGDYWRHLGVKGQRNFTTLVIAESITNFPPETVHFPGPITVLTGLNGVGKSTILNSVYLLVSRDENATISLALLRKCVGQIRGEVVTNGGIVMATATLDKGTRILDPEALDFEVILIDPAFEIPDLIKSYREEQNLGEALEQVEPIIYAPEELSEVSWLVGKTYSACRVYELDGFYNRPVAPYFCAESGGGVYATEEMGLGEASLHYIFWALKRAQKKSLILIEEPETFISARSQSALMDLLAKTCLVKDCTAIVTTHSPQVFSKVPPKDTLIMVQSNGVPKVIVKDTSPARLAALSVPPVNEKAGYLLVEDRMAREFTRYWMRFACPELLGHWRVIDLGSAGHVVALLKIFPIMGDKWFRAVGVLDGDERDKNWTSKAPISYLPTNDPPEVYLRTTILANAGGIAADLNLDPEEFQISLAALDGMDHHDWFMELANAFAMKGLTFEKLVACAVETWIAANEEISAMAAEELRVATQ